MILSTSGIIQSKAAAEGGYDTNAQAFFDAAGITDTTQKDAVNTMVKSLKSNSLWDKLVVIYPMVGGTSSTHKFNLKEPIDLYSSFSLLFVGTVNHDYRGALFNGANGYANTFLAGNNNNLSLNSTSMWFYATGKNNNDLGEKAMMGGNNITLNTPYSDQNHSQLNDSYGGTGQNDPGFTNGFIGTSRISNAGFTYYKNGTSLFYASNATSTSQNPRNLYIGAYYEYNNGNNPHAEYCPLYCGFSAIGIGLNSTEAANLNTIVTTYQTSLSRK
jgi:hypothetical protein